MFGKICFNKNQKHIVYDCISYLIKVLLELLKNLKL